MLFEHAGETLDKTNDIIGLLFWRTETGVAVLRDDELITVHTATVTADMDKRRITHSVTSVQGVTGVKKDFLNVDTVEVVLISHVIAAHHRSLLNYYLPIPCP